MTGIAHRTVHEWRKAQGPAGDGAPCARPVRGAAVNDKGGHHGGRP